MDEVAPPAPDDRAVVVAENHQVQGNIVQGVIIEIAADKVLGA